MTNGNNIADRAITSIFCMIVLGIISLIFPSVISGSIVVFAFFVSACLAGWSVLDFINVAFDKNAVGSVSQSAFTKIIIMAAICVLFLHATITPAYIGAILEIVLAIVGYIFL